MRYMGPNRESQESGLRLFVRILDTGCSGVRRGTLTAAPQASP